MLTYASLSETGNRTTNEDCCCVLEHGGAYFFALADGLGGHGRGEVASAVAVRESVAVFESAPTAFDLLPRCMTAAQRTLLATQQADGSMRDMKTTLVLLHVHPGLNRAQWAHVGDSRLYCFEGGTLAVRTLDHSVPQMLVATGQLRERDIRFHEDRNRLVRALGVEWSGTGYTLSDPLPLRPPMSFLLCSDGFWEYCLEKEMLRSLRRAQSPKAWLDAMQKTVLKRGKHKNMDNYTAIAIFIR